MYRNNTTVNPFGVKADQKPAKDMRTVSLSLVPIHNFFHNLPRQRLMLHCCLNNQDSDFIMIYEVKGVVNTHM